MQKDIGPAAIVEDWERADPFADYSGDTSKWSITDQDPLEGSRSVSVTSGNKTPNAIWRSDPYAPEQGDTFATVIRAVEGERSMFYWAVSGGNPEENDAYGIYFNPVENTISLIVEVDGNQSTVASDSPQLSSGDYDIEIEWSNTSPEFTVRIYEWDATTETRGNQASQFTGSDSTHSSGGIGFSDDLDGNSATLRDYYRIIG